MRKKRKKDPRNTQQYRDKQKQLYRYAKKHALPCHLCGKQIDYTLPFYHKHAFTADHIIPINKGGATLGQLAPAHRSCNSRKKDRYQLVQAIKPITPLNNW